MHPILENGKKSNEETVEAGTSFVFNPTIDTEEDIKLKDELMNAKDNIRQILASLKINERKI